jgi:hypothetical protein
VSRQSSARARRGAADRWLTALVAVVLIGAWADGRDAASAAPEMATVFVPAGVTFVVTDVQASTPGSPTPTPLRFVNGTLKNRRALGVSVRADSDFTPTGGGTPIPASAVSWTTSGVTNGFGANGTLSTSSYGLVYQSTEEAPLGGLDLSWTLAAPGTGVVAGAHQMTVRWRFESIRP